MIHISFEFKDEAWGGANQFLKSLKNEFIKLGVHTDKLDKASHVLFNSHHNAGIIRRLKTELPHLKFVHRVDGPMKLYNSSQDQRDDLVLFYFRNGANHASAYTQSKLISENIKWNLRINKKKIKALLINARNANAFTGKDGFKGLKILADCLSQEY